MQERACVVTLPSTHHVCHQFGFRAMEADPDGVNPEPALLFRRPHEQAIHTDPEAMKVVKLRNCSTSLSLTTKLHNFHARSYSATTGRFTQTDPSSSCNVLSPLLLRV